jgi:hypothetical protein
MFDIRFSPQAVVDLDEIKCYVSDHLCNPQAAQDLIALILEKHSISAAMRWIFKQQQHVDFVRRVPADILSFSDLTTGPAI